jgi:hypothetical protein
MILLFTVLALPLVFSSSLLVLLHSLPHVPHLLNAGPASLLIQIGGGIVVCTSASRRGRRSTGRRSR